MFRRLAITACVLAGGAARAEDAPSPIATYAIVVGSNAGGPGQTDLRYAEEDAKRVGAVLADLGGYPRANIEIVGHPTPDQLRERLGKLADRVALDAAAGRQARVFFYYSGHARAAAIDLGSDELPLEELRERLFAIKATLTVVVLDACQSGAFSRVKGAAPAADFSYSSREHLDASGVAVLASSTGSEFSQESEQLHSSYFTHHLLVGLRGAGDANHDGQVSLDEAYRYAYHQTLLATAETAVGGQHVTFEADLKGHGEVPLSFPRAATASIELPAALEGKTLVEDRGAHAVIAETYKAKGAAVRIAVAPGDYEVTVRHERDLSRCEVTAPGSIDLSRCRTEAIVNGTRKGGGYLRPTRIEIMGTLGDERHDGYTDTLGTFGYREDSFLNWSNGLTLTGLRHWRDYVWLGGSIGFEKIPSWSRDSDGLYPLRLDWSTTIIGGAIRGELPLQPDGRLQRIKLYAQGTAGLGIGRTNFRDQSGMTTTDTFAGPALSGGAGLLFGGDNHNVALKGLGLSLGYRLDYAPVIHNLIGDTHASGGSRFTFAMSYSF